MLQTWGFLPFYLKNELVNTNKVEGRLDPVTPRHAQVALCSDCKESTSFGSPQKVAVGGIQGCSLGHWSEMMWVLWLHCNWPSDRDVLDSRWCHWNQSDPLFFYLKIYFFYFTALKPTAEKLLLSTGWQRTHFSQSSGKVTFGLRSVLRWRQSRSCFTKATLMLSGSKWSPVSACVPLTVLDISSVNALFSTQVIKCDIGANSQHIHKGSTIPW